MTENTTYLSKVPEISGITGLSSVWYQIDVTGQELLRKNLDRSYQNYCSNMSSGKSASGDFVVREKAPWHNVVMICPHKHGGSQDRIICIPDPREGQGDKLIVLEYSLKHNGSYFEKGEKAQKMYEAFKRNPASFPQYLDELEKKSKVEQKRQEEIFIKKTLKLDKEITAKLTVQELYNGLLEWYELGNTPEEKKQFLITEAQTVKDKFVSDKIDIDDLRRMRKIMKNESEAKKIFPNDIVRNALSDTLKETDNTLTNNRLLSKNCNWTEALKKQLPNQKADISISEIAQKSGYFSKII